MNGNYPRSTSPSWRENDIEFSSSSSDDESATNNNHSPIKSSSHHHPSTTSTPSPPPSLLSRTILHLDIDCFYPQCHMMTDPTLREKPLAVKQKHIIVTCNYPARERGIKKLMSLNNPLVTSCRDLIIVDGSDLTMYRRCSRRIYNLFRECIATYCHENGGRSCCPVRKGGMDEMTADVTSFVSNGVSHDDNHPSTNDTDVFVYGDDDSTVILSEDQSGRVSHVSFVASSSSTSSHFHHDASHTRLYDNPTSLAHCRHRLHSAATTLALRIQRHLRQKTGFTCSIGISTSPMLAKLAAEMKKPHGATILYPWRSDGIVRSMPLRKIPGLGFATARRLTDCLARYAAADRRRDDERDFATCGDLRRVPLSVIASSLGDDDDDDDCAARRLWSLCRGIDNSVICDDGGGLSKTLSVEESFRRGSVMTEGRVLGDVHTVLCRRLVCLLEERIDDDDDEDAAAAVVAASRVYFSTVRVTLRNCEKGRHATYRKQMGCDGRHYVKLKGEDEKIEYLLNVSRSLLVALMGGLSHPLNMTKLNVAVANFSDVGVNQTRNNITKFFQPALSAGSLKGDGKVTSATLTSFVDGTENTTSKKIKISRDDESSSKRSSVTIVPNGIDPEILKELPRDIVDEILQSTSNRNLHMSGGVTHPKKKHRKGICEGSEPFPPHEYVHIAMQAAPSGGSPMSAGGGPDDFAMASPSSSTAGRGAAAGAGSAMSPVPKPGDRVTQMAVVEEEDADGEAAAAAAASADSPTSGRRPGSRSGSRKTKRPGSASSRLSNSSLSSPTSSTSTPPRVPRDGASPGGGSSAASARGSTSSKRGRHSMPAKKSRSHAQLRTRAMLSPVMETPPPRMTRSTSSGSGHSSVSHRSRNISNAQHERALHMFRLQRRQQHLLFNSSPFMGKELDTLQEQKRVIRGHTEAMTTELVLEDGPDGWRDPSAGAGSKTTAVNLGEVAAWSPTHPRDTIELSDLGKLLYGEAVPPELLRRFTRQVAGSTHGSRSTRHTLHRTMSEGSLVFSAYKMSSGASTTDISGNRSEQSNVSSPLGGSVSTNSVHTTPHKLQARGPPPKSKIVLSPSAQAFLDCTFRGPHVFTPRQSPHLESPPRGSRRHRGHHDIRRSFSHHVRQTTVDSMTRTSPLAAGGGGLTRTGMAAPVVSPHSGTFGGNMSPTAAAAFANAAANAGLADSNPNSGTAGNGGGATAGGAGTSATPTQPGASAGAGDGGVFSTPAASSPATSAAPSASGTPQSQPNGGPPSSSLSSSRLMKTPSTANSSGGPPADEDVLATPMSAPVDGSSSSKPPRLRRISEASANRKWMPSLPSHAAPKTLGARRRSLGMMPMELDAVAAAAGHYLSTPSDADLGALIKPYPASASAGKHPKTPQPGPSPGGDQPPSSDEKDGGAMGRRRLTRHKDFLMVTESFGKNAQGGTVKKAVIFRPKDEHRMSLASAGDAKVGGLYSRTMHRAGQQGRRAALGVHLSALDEASVETSESEHGASGGTGSDDSDSDWGSDCEAVEELDEVLGDLCKPVVDHDSDLDALSDVGDVDDDDDDDDDSDSDVGELLSGDDALAGLGLDGDVASDDEATADGDGGAGAGAGAGAACREPRRSAAATAAERLSITAAKHLCNNRLRLTYGAAENQGGRESMEDCTTALVDMNAAVGLPEGTPAVAYFGVYDGHNGDDTSNFLAKELHLNVAASESFLTDPSEALRAGFLATDKEIVEGQETKEAMGINFKFSGSTAIVCLVRAPGAGLPLQLIVANVGDCRAVLSRAGQATELSSDQTPSREDEHARIVAAGGWVHNGRLNSVLAVSRAFGDVEHKSLKERCWERTFVSDPLIATPEIRVETVEPQDEFVILASDGVWDSLTSQQAVNFVRKRLVEHQNAERAASELLHKALSLTSTDNATAVVICLNQKLDDRQVDEAVASVPSVASLISAAEEESKEFGGGGGAAEVEVSYDVGYGGVDSDDNDGSSSESDYSDVGSLGSLPG